MEHGLFTHDFNRYEMYNRSIVLFEGYGGCRKGGACKGGMIGELWTKEWLKCNDATGATVHRVVLRKVPV